MYLSPRRLCQRAKIARSSKGDVLINTFGRLLFQATRVIFGDVGAELMGVAFWMYEIGIAASGILATSIGLNVITNHGACSVIFALVATLLTCAMASFREFRHIAFLGWAGLFSIIISVCVLMVSVMVSDKPPLAPEVDWDKQLKLIGHPSPAAALAAVMNMLFAL